LRLLFVIEAIPGVEVKAGRLLFVIEALLLFGFKVKAGLPLNYL